MALTWTVKRGQTRRRCVRGELAAAREVGCRFAFKRRKTLRPGPATAYEWRETLQLGGAAAALVTAYERRR